MRNELTVLVLFVACATGPHWPMLAIAQVEYHSRPEPPSTEVSDLGKISGYALFLGYPIAWILSSLLLGQNLSIFGYAWSVIPALKGLCGVPENTGTPSQEGLPGCYVILACIAGVVAVMTCMAVAPGAFFIFDLILLTIALVLHGSYAKFRDAVGPRLLVKSFYRLHPELKDVYSLQSLLAALHAAAPTDSWATAHSLLKELQALAKDNKSRKPTPTNSNPSTDAANRVQKIRDKIAQLDLQITNLEQAIQDTTAKGEITTIPERVLGTLRHERLQLEQNLNRELATNPNLAP